MTTPVFYHDGAVEAVSVDTINVLPDQLSADLDIGQFGGTMAGSYNFDGVIDEVRIYNRKLSAAEIAALYRFGEDEFAYDDLGNRTGNIRQRSTVENYVVNNTTNRYSSIGGNNLSYDDCGNLTTDKSGYVYTYDYENRLIKITDGVSTVVEYTYDGLGRRIEKDDNIGNAVTTYIYSGWQVLTEYEDPDVGATVERDFIWGNYLDESLMMIVDDTTDYYFAHDHLYSPVALLNSSGTVIECYEYDGYGKMTRYDPDFTTWSGTPVGNPIFFTGQRLDELDNGDLIVMYYKNRYYDPDSGRFITQDPYGMMPYGYIGNMNFKPVRQYTDGMSLYTYCSINPVNNNDALGLYEEGHGYAFVPFPQKNAQCCVCCVEDLYVTYVGDINRNQAIRGLRGIYADNEMGFGKIFGIVVKLNYIYAPIYYGKKGSNDCKITWAGMAESSTNETRIPYNNYWYDLEKKGQKDLPYAPFVDIYRDEGKKRCPSKRKLVSNLWSTITAMPEWVAKGEFIYRITVYSGSRYCRFRSKTIQIKHTVSTEDGLNIAENDYKIDRINNYNRK